MKKVFRPILFLSVFLGISAGLFPAFADETAKVEGVADGDTIDISKDRRVDLIGIDTPEAGHGGKLYSDAKFYHKDIYEVMGMGKAAKLFLRSLLQDREVRLEFDETITDKKARQRVFVYLPVCKGDCQYQPVEGFEYIKLDDGTYIFVNATMLKSGYARVKDTESNPKYRDLFITLYKEAGERGTGFWLKKTA